MADLYEVEGDRPDPEGGGRGEYEPPKLTPIGNLNDILAGGGSLCDDAETTGTGPASLGC